MTISVQCPNGHRLKAKDEHAGKTFACPKCRAQVTVPRPAAPPAHPGGEQPVPVIQLEPAEDPAGFGDPLGGSADPLADPLGNVDLGGAMDLASLPGAADPLMAPSSGAMPAMAVAPTARQAPRKTRSRDRDRQRMLLIVGGIGGGALLVVVLLVVVLLVVLGGGGGDGEVAAGNGDGGAADGAADAGRGMSLFGKRQRRDDVNEMRKKLMKIALAFHNHHDTFRSFAPPRADLTDSIVGSGAQPSPLSWRVHLLPFLDQAALYEQFHLDEPWDSEHNKTLLEKMPEIYDTGSGKSTTRFRVFTGPEMLFGAEKPPSIKDVRDGTSNTILVVLAGTDRGVPWTQPEDFPLDRADPLASLGNVPGELIIFAFMDGSVRTVRQSIKAETFAALVTPNGKEIIEADALDAK